MYTVEIGKRFLSIWNERNNASLTGKEFFDKHFFNLFLNHEVELISVINSPFKAKLGKEALSSGKNPKLIRKETLDNKISNLTPDASFGVGFPAAGIDGTTSAQVSSIELKFSHDDLYCSWIGAALGIGVAGGTCLLINDESILWSLYEGWKYYRYFVNNTQGLKGNQIETWNGQWITHALNEYYDPKNPLLNFAFDQMFEMKVLPKKPGEKVAGKVLAMNTQRWVEVVFALTEHFIGKRDSITAYVYSLGQTNTTIGFIPIKIHEVDKLRKLVNLLFVLPAEVKDWNKLKHLYETYYSFPRVCEAGSIGLKAIQPKPFEYIGNKSLNYSKEFNLLWSTAMLNNAKLTALALDFATLLQKTDVTKQKETSRGKTNVTRKKNDILAINNQRAFVDQCGELYSNKSYTKDDKDLVHTVVEEVNLMNVDTYRNFIAKARADARYLESTI